MSTITGKNPVAAPTVEFERTARFAELQEKKKLIVRTNTVGGVALGCLGGGLVHAVSGPVGWGLFALYSVTVLTGVYIMGNYERFLEEEIAKTRTLDV